MIRFDSAQPLIRFLCTGTGAILHQLAARSAPIRYDHVDIVMEENRTPTQIMGDTVNVPYITWLANGDVRMNAMFAIEHPSQPNYLQLFSSSNQGVVDDDLPAVFSTTPTASYPMRTPNLAAGLIAAGFTFAGYSEDIDTAGATDGADYDPHSATHSCVSYLRKHNPWANWVAKTLPLPSNQLTSSFHRAFSQFPADFNQLPTVSFVPAIADSHPVANFGTNGLPSVRLLVSGSSDILQVQYVRRKSTSTSGLTYSLQFSSDFDGWATNQTTSVSSINSLWERVTARTPANGPSPRRFARLQPSLEP